MGFPEEVRNERRDSDPDQAPEQASGRGRPEDGGPVALSQHSALDERRPEREVGQDAGDPAEGECHPGETEILGEKKVCEKDRDERLAQLSDRDRE